MPAGSLLDNARLSRPAAELDVTTWLNTQPLSLSELRGQIVAVVAFQMLCPGCVAYGLPQARAVHDLFSAEGVTVIGLHTVFEHHDAMTVTSLRAFVAEYRLSFPIGVDRHEPGQTRPVTFSHYQMRGTPTTLLIDRAGQLRAHAFGEIDNLVLGAAIGKLLTEDTPPDPAMPDLRPGAATPAVCEADGTCH